jgi:hypothetical protein
MNAISKWASRKKILQRHAVFLQNGQNVTSEEDKLGQQ